MRYFAYGSNMDPVQMASRCPGAHALGRALLRGHRVTFVNDACGFDSGVATIVADADAGTWGVLWEIDEEHLVALDEWEGYPVAYDRIWTVVDAAEPVEALVYVANLLVPEPPAKPYLDGILRGARAHGLPEEYVAALERCAG